MAYARALAVLLCMVLLAPAAVHAAGPTLTKYTITPALIYPTASAESGLATSTAITLVFSEKISATIRVRTATGALVRTYTTGDAVLAPTPRIWNGTTILGVPVAAGTYTLEINATSTATGLAFTDTSKSVTVALPPRSVPPALPTQAYTIPLIAGWNLVSLPVTPQDPRAPAVFGASPADAVWSYDPSDPNADGSGWLAYDPGHPELSNRAVVSAGYGYFVHSTGAGSVSGAGALFAPGGAPPLRTLGAGWNLVGSFAAARESIDDAFASIGFAGLEYTALWRFDPLSQSFVLPADVAPGDAFWILTPLPAHYAPSNL